MEEMKVPAGKEENTKSGALCAEIPKVQLQYARLLHFGSTLGIIFLGTSFLLYITGMIPAHVPAELMHGYCSLSSAELVQVLEMPTGWTWFSQIGKADYLSLLGIAFLSGLTIIGYLTLLLPSFLRERDVPYSLISLAEILLLLLAASGILAVGAH